MDRKKVERDSEDQMREEIRRRSPRPSAAHDRRILDVARATAAATRRPKPRRSWLMVGAGIAASTLVALSVWQMLPVNTLIIDTGLRGNGDEAVWPAENRSLAAEPDEFRWAAQAGAELYRVNIYNDSAELLWTSAWVAENRLPAPEVAQLMFSSGARYFWVVKVDGTAAREELGPYWFRIE